MAKIKDYPKASVWRRLVAHILDSIFAFLLGLLLVIPGLVYYFIKDGLKNGQSWGNRIVGLQVVNLETKIPCSKWQSLLRSLFLCISVLNLIEVLMVIFEPKGQRLADKIMGTNVIEVKK